MPPTPMCPVTTRSFGEAAPRKPPGKIAGAARAMPTLVERPRKLRREMPSRVGGEAARREEETGDGFLFVTRASPFLVDHGPWRRSDVTTPTPSILLSFVREIRALRSQIIVISVALVDSENDSAIMSGGGKPTR